MGRHNEPRLTDLLASLDKPTRLEASRRFSRAYEESLTQLELFPDQAGVSALAAANAYKAVRKYLRNEAYR